MQDTQNFRIMGPRIRSRALDQRLGHAPDQSHLGTFSATEAAKFFTAPSSDDAEADSATE